MIINSIATIPTWKVIAISAILLFGYFLHNLDIKAQGRQERKERMRIIADELEDAK